MRDKGLDFDCCFTSVQTRAIRTLHLALTRWTGCGSRSTKDWRLNERHYGGLTGLNKQEMIDKVGAEQVKIWRRSYDIPPPPLPEDSPYDVSAATAAMPASRCRHREPQGHDRPRAALLRARSGAEDRAGAARASACSSPPTAIRCAGSSNICRTSATTRSSGSKSRPASRSSTSSQSRVRREMAVRLVDFGKAGQLEMDDGAGRAVPSDQADHPLQLGPEALRARQRGEVVRLDVALEVADSLPSLDEGGAEQAVLALGVERQAGKVGAVLGHAAPLARRG
jgi:hypothetical protein